jgi:thiol-disulfide isomerase/thioredoxin
MAIDRFSFLVRLLFPLHLLVVSLSVSSADSEFFLLNDLKPGQQLNAPDITLYDLNNQPIAVSYKDNITLVHFWASWCLPCRKELPLIEALQNRYKENPRFQIITVAADSHKNINAYLTRHRVKLSILIDQYGRTLRQFEVNALPSSYLINLRGLIEYQAAGAIDWSSPKIKNKLDTLLLDSASK